MTARLEICNEALSRIGSLPIMSETARGAAAVLKIYDGQLRVITGARPWSFSMRTRALQRETDTPPAGFWAYQFRLPAEAFGPPLAVFKNKNADHFTDYELGEQYVYADEPELFARFRVVPPVGLWSPYFREALIVAVAGWCATSINKDAKTGNEMLRLAFGDPRVPGDLGLVGKAGQHDAQSKPSQVLMETGGPLIDCRS